MSDEVTQTAAADPGPIAKSAQDAQMAVTKGNEKGENIRRGLIDAAREKVKAVFAPEKPAAPASEAAPTKETPLPATPEAPKAAPGPTAGEIVFQQANQALSQAIQAKIVAEQQAVTAVAEANRLKELAKNPLAFLNEQKINVDQWQARLANGGKPTAEEQFQADMTAKMQAFDAKIAQAERDAALRVVQAQLPPMLAKDFPIVNARLGVEGAVKAAQEASKAMGKPVDVKDFFTHLERHFKTEFEATQKALAPVPAKDAPKKDAAPTTMTNRTTSTTGGTAKTFVSKADAQAAGRAMIKQLAQAGRL